MIAGESTGSAAEPPEALLGGVPLAGFYQDKVAPNFGARLALFEDVVLASGSSLLDVGSNLGDFTSHFARRGMFALGVEEDETAVREARQRHASVPSCAFAAASVEPANVDALPHTDVLLLLSVHHNWYSAYGPAVADLMARVLVSRARLTIFEGPSRTSRYGAMSSVGFVDNDSDSVTAWYRAFLGNIAAAVGGTVRLLGAAPCLGTREPHRWIWAIRRERGF